MAQNIWDYSNILMSNRVGANIGAGITQAAGAVSDGMVRGKQVKEERKQYTTVLETMDPDGAKSGKYAEASLGELRGALDSLAATRVKQKEARDAQLAQAQLAMLGSQQRRMDTDTSLAQQEANALSAIRAPQAAAKPFPGIPQNFAAAATAAQKGMAPPPAGAGGSRAASYVNAGGSNPSMVQALRGLEASRPGFQLMTDPVTGARLGLDSNGNASVISKPEKPVAPPTSTKIDLGGGNFVYHLPGDRYLDKDLKPIMWSQEKTDSFSQLMNEGNAEKDKKPKDAKDQYSDVPIVSTQAAYDALPPGAVFKDASGAVKRKGGRP